MHKHWVSKWHKLCGAPAPVDAVPRVLVTRPEQDAAPWVAALQGAGLEATTFPLLALSPVLQVQDLRNVHAQLQGQQAVMFVSANAVSNFFAARPPGGPSGFSESDDRPRAWVTGPGSRQALLREGVAAACIDLPALDAGQFDSEALWQQVSSQLKPGDRVLIVRGDDRPHDSTAASPEEHAGTGRDWLATAIGALSACPEFVVAYQRRAPNWSAQEFVLARAAASDGSVWLLSSGQALANLCALMPSQPWQLARALATHSRIALAARQAGFGLVLESRPVLPELLLSIESLR